MIFHLVCLGWIFFRAETVSSAVSLIYGGMTRFDWIPEYTTATAFLALFTAPLFAIDIVNEGREEEYLFKGVHPYVRVAIGASFLILILLFAGSKSNAFIYFQF